MKAIIRQKSELTLNCTQHFIFDITDGDGTILLSSQTVECTPSNAVNEIRNKVQNFENEYQASEELAVGMEIS